MVFVKYLKLLKFFFKTYYYAVVEQSLMVAGKDLMI